MSESWSKIWGTNTEVFRNDSCSVNVLEVKKGGTCSYHRHQSKYNLFYVLSGSIVITTDLGDTTIREGQTFTVLPRTGHLFRGLEDSRMIEVMFVSYDESDIERLTQGFLNSEG